METIITVPAHKFPCMAIWTGGDNLKESQMPNVKIEDVLVLSEVKISEDGDDIGIYVQHAIGGKTGYFTEKLHEYQIFPRGFQITLTNNFEPRDPQANR